MVNFKHLTDAELKQKLVQQQPALQQDNDNPNVLRHNLNVHQIELEMQYRELRKSQLELETVRDRYADLYDFAPVGYLTFDKKGCIVEINLTAADMLGKPRGLIVGTPFIAYLAPGNSRVFLNHLHDVLDSEDKITQGVKVKNREGTEVGVRLVSIADRQTNGQEKMCRTAMIDVTEFNQAQEMKKIYLEERAHLARLSSMGEMASSIAHEVLQPLCAITTCTDVLRRALLSSVPDQGQDKNKELDDIFDMIISQTDRIGNIVRNIRGFSKK